MRSAVITVIQCCQCDGRWRIISRPEAQSHEQVVDLGRMMCPLCSIICGHRIVCVIIGECQLVADANEIEWPEWIDC